MKTEKEKAEELVNKFSPILPWYTKLDNLRKSKQCALICVDEIIEALKDSTDFIFEETSPQWEYWQKVKTKLQKL
jgi:hypothetical protein